MKILIYIPQLTIGGTEKHVAWLLKKLVNNHEVFLWVKERGGYWHNKIEKKGINIIYWGGTSYLTNRINIIKKLISIGNIDLFHSFGYADHFFDVLLINFLKKSVIVKSTRNVRHWDDKKKVKIREKIRNYFIDYHLVNSKSVLAILTEIEFVDKNKISLIPNPVEIIPQDRNRIKVSNNSFNILMIANFKPVKNNIESLLIIKKLQNKTSTPVKLNLVGQGPSKMECEKWVTDNDLTTKIFFHELAPDEIPPIIMKSDLYLTTSFSEGSSNSLMESMAHGLPFVSTNTGNVKELIEQGFHGEIYEQGNILDACNKILNFMKVSKDKTDKIRSENINLVKEYFKSEIIAGKYIEFYNSIIKS